MFVYKTLKLLTSPMKKKETKRQPITPSYEPTKQNKGVNIYATPPPRPRPSLPRSRIERKRYRISILLLWGDDGGG